jgi:hypothetical protein
MAEGGDWNFEPGLELSETYRSNVNLAPDDLKDHDWITQVNPGLTLGYAGVRGTLDLNYTLNAVFFREDSDRDDTYNEANANTSFYVIEDRLFLDVYGRYGQENVDPAGRIALDNSYDTDNRTNVGVWQVQPWWQQPIGRYAVSTAYYSYSEVRYDDTDEDAVDRVFTNVQNSETNSFRWLLNDTLESRFGWNTQYLYSRTDFDDDSPEFEYQKAQLQLTAGVGARTRLIGTVGKESDIEKDSSDGNLDEHLWNVGFEWEPTSLQFLEVLVGRRYYGTSYEFHWKRTGARGNLAVDYTEEPITANNVNFDNVAFDPRPDQPGFGTPRLDTGVYLRRRGAGTFSYRFARSDFRAYAYWEKRDSEGQDATGRDEKTWGGDLGFDWQLTPRMDLLFGGGWDRREEDDSGEKEDLWTVTAGLRRELRENMNLELEGGTYRRESDDDFDYTDNFGSLTFNVTF